MVRRERKRWHARAMAIPDPALREDALHTQQTKWGHSEGAAAFAVLVPRAHRSSMVRMVIAYELMIDYLDTTSERPADDLFANNLRLHEALDAALAVEGVDDSFYELHPHRDDGGYLSDHVATCRAAFVALPSFEAIAPAAQRSARLYAESQSLHHAHLFTEDGIHPEGIARARTTEEEVSRNPDLLWWELLAAGGSSLPVFSLMAAATRPSVTEEEAEEIRTAYYPCASALHILLDGLVDWSADRADGAPNQIDHYGSAADASNRLRLLAREARGSLSALPMGEMHTTILDGLGGYYLSPPHVWEPESREIASGVFASLGPMVKPAWAVHRIRHGAWPFLLAATR